MPTAAPKSLSRPSRRSFAHVGWTGSTIDKKRSEFVTQHERTRGIHTKLLVDEVKFDLSYTGLHDNRFGCDFLAGTRIFDVVILHWIFLGWDPEEPRPAIANHFGFALSPKHSLENWRARLTQSHAQRIYVFGGRHEVSGTWLMEIPEYAKHLKPFGTLFERTQ